MLSHLECGPPGAPLARQVDPKAASPGGRVLAEGSTALPGDSGNSSRINVRVLPVPHPDIHVVMVKVVKPTPRAL